MRRFLLITALLVCTESPAFAHVGVGSTASFAAGVAHPLTGIDHIAAMVSVGLWAGLKGGRMLWVWPMTFVVMMLIGGALGMARISLPYVEPAIVASVVTLGILVMLAIDLPISAGALIVGTFAIFHGHAHGSEAAGIASGAEYMAGFAAATASLHVLGLAIALLMNRVDARALVRVTGLACVLVGFALFYGIP